MSEKKKEKTGTDTRSKGDVDTTSPTKRTRRGGNTSASTTSASSGAPQTPVRDQQPQQHTPKSDFKNFAESIGSPFGVSMGVGLFSPQSSAPFTPGSIHGGESGTHSAVVPTSRDWSPFCHSTSFEFDASSPCTGAPMDKIFHNMRGGRSSSSSVDQSPAEYISSSTWGGHLAQDLMMMDSDQARSGVGLASPLGMGMSFPPALQHLYPHHQHITSDSSDGITSRLSNDLFSANKCTDIKKRKAQAGSPPPPDRTFGDAPPSPGFEAIAAAARELESQSNENTGSKNKTPARRKAGKDKDKPLLAPRASAPTQGPGLLKGVVGSLHCSTSSEGEQVPTMRFSQSTGADKTGTLPPKASHKGLLPPYLPQKSSTGEGDIVAKKTIKSEIQTYIKGIDASTKNNGGSGLQQVGSPEMVSMPGKKVPDISPATKHISVTCNCKKSKCLKLYCDCFRVQQYCSGCHCNNCSNLKEFDTERQAAVTAITERNPEAFKPRITQVDAQLLTGGGNNGGIGSRMGQHLQGCHCKKSACLKKYCECFQADVPCHERCRCLECKNTPAAREAKLAATGGRQGVSGASKLTPSAVTSAAMLKTYADPKPSSDLLTVVGTTDGNGQSRTSHLDLASSLLSPTPSTSQSMTTPSSGGSSRMVDDDDLKPIYNKAQAEQAALEIVSAFLRGELTVPGMEYLSTKASAMRNYSVSSSPQQGLHPLITPSSSLPLMEKLSEFEESRILDKSGQK